MCFGSMITQAACCAGQACCSNICQYLGACCGLNFKQQVRLSHITLLIVSIGVILMISQLFPAILKPFLGLIDCHGQKGNEYLCLGVSSVYRICLALTITFTMVLMGSLGHDKGAKIINEGCWSFKIISVFGLWLAFMFASSGVLDVYVQVARWVSFCFVIFFIIMLIDLCYCWGEAWIRMYDAGYEKYKYFLLGTTVLLYGLNFYFIIKGFDWFGGPECSSNIWVLIINIVQIVLVTGLSVSGIAANGSLLTSAAVSSIITYFTMAGLTSTTENYCTSFLPNESSIPLIEITVDSLLVLCSLVYISFANSSSTDTVTLAQTLEIKPVDDEEYEEEEFTDENGEKKKRKKKKEVAEPLKPAPVKEEDDITEYQGNAFVVFQLMMVLCSMYAAMMLTNWAPLEGWEHRDAYYERNDTAKWLKISESYITCALYIWTMIAPRLFPDRF